MAERLNLNHPWLVAVWPGMGNVALSAGYYLLAKLGMHVIAEYEARDEWHCRTQDVVGAMVASAWDTRLRIYRSVIS